MAYKKKFVGLLVVIALCGMGLVLCVGQSSGAESRETTLDFADDPNFFPTPTENMSTRKMFFKMMISVLLVVALGIAVVYLSKRLLPRITNLPSKEIRVVSTVHIGPRRSIHLIEAGNQRILIGSTNESITKLVDIVSQDDV